MSTETRRVRVTRDPRGQWSATCQACSQTMGTFDSVILGRWMEEHWHDGIRTQEEEAIAKATPKPEMDFDFFVALAVWFLGAAYLIEPWLAVGAPVALALGAMGVRKVRR